MITSFDTNFVYFAEGLKHFRYAEIVLRMIEPLHGDKRVACGFLPKSSSPLHIWARDYMPVQVSKDKFVLFLYAPDYLKDYPEYKPDITAILSDIGIRVMSSDIIIDGGNFISCGEKVIMTDKIFRENQHYDHNVLIDTLSQLLEAEIVLIPEDYYDEYGHADGMVRYIGEGRVLLNNYCDFDKALRKKLLAALSPHFDITELHYGAYTNSSWAFLNFLHVGQHIFIPMVEDTVMDDMLGEKALKQIGDAFPLCKCHPVYHCENIVREGGALNCSSWNILTDLPEEDNNHKLPKTV